MKKTFGFNQVSKHNKTKDCWLIIKGKVYDVTPFMEDHPGGPEVLLAATGKDATADFEDIGHSNDAKGMMDEYYIGEVENSTSVPLKAANYAADHNSYINPHHDDTNSGFVFKILVPLFIFIFGLALALTSYTKDHST